MKLLCKIIIFAAAISVMSCNAPKKVPYLVGVETIPSEFLVDSTKVEPTIVPGDLLNIAISSSDYASVALFNKGQYINPDGSIGGTSPIANTSATQGSDASTAYYLVGARGDIDMPIIGNIKVAGLNKSQVADSVIDRIYPKYVKEKPTVDIRLMNFRVTVTGAVNSPGIYQAANERMNILEALTMAGDLNIQGRRDNVMLIRTNVNGTREVVRLNLQDKDLLRSPYFALQQNDFIYVEPNRSMAQNSWSMNSAVGVTLTVVGGLSSIAGLVIGVMNLVK